ncbi:MAG: heparan-alpha-glucosaminide N-acetyltransferase domain-containing protein [Myxococcota bacterium]
MTETRTDRSRLAAIDWMRGFVMVLMAVDHASQMFNAGRLASDSAYLANLFVGGDYWIPGTELDAAQFVTRWISHLCAPTFLFLSGTSLAMSFEKRRAKGMAEGELDRHLLIRAAIILGCEGLLSLMAGSGMLMLQVLFAIGASMIAMVALRRLPTRVLLALGLGWLFGSEFVLMRFFPIPDDLTSGAVDHFSTLSMLLFVPGNGSVFVNSYPMIHWLAMMLLGWAFGRHLLAQPDTPHDRQDTEKLLLLCGCSALLLWTFVRSQNAYGNMGLLRDDTSVLQFLHMSKYPPALVYSLMELGLMALGLVFCLRTERRLPRPANPNNPLLVYGQTALFFYMLHFVLLGAGAMTLGGGMMAHGLRETWLAAGVVLGVLYPICLAFRRLKRRHPDGFLQYI